MGTADGKLLGSTNNRSPEKVLTMLKNALKEFKATEVEPIMARANTSRWNPNLKYPEGGLCVRVNAKVLGGYSKSDNRWQKLAQTAISRDNLWATKSEHDELVKGSIPLSFQKRLIRFHLVDNTRGEPPMWKEDEIKSMKMNLNGKLLTGKISLKSKDGSRTYDADLFGYIEHKEGRIIRFDIIAKGQFSGEGPYTKGAPKGKFPLAVSFSLADGKDTADGIPPQGSRGWVPGYIKFSE